MAFSGNGTITADGISAIIDEYQADTTDIRVRITYLDSSNGDTTSFDTNNINLLTNFDFANSLMQIGSADLNIEFDIDPGDTVTKVELRFTDTSGTITMDEYSESELYEFGGKYIVTGWSITLQG